jgi:hypothetical protein
MNFQEFKDEILRRAKEANACTSEYMRALQSNNFDKLMRVIKDNFGFACEGKVIDSSLIESCKDEFNANGIYCNVNVSAGFLLVSGNASVEARGNASVEASDNASVKARGNASVKARGNESVEAWGNASVEAWDNTYVTSYSIIECKLSDNAIYRIRGSNTIRYISDKIKFEKVNTI